MSEINRDQLIEKVNQAVAEADAKKRMRLQILLRRYLGGERTDRLFEAMKIETTLTTTHRVSLRLKARIK